MVQIIGQNPDFQAECRNCGTQFTFTKADVRPGQQIDHDDYAGIVYCPGEKCGKPVGVQQTLGAEQVAKLRRDEDYY